MAIQIFSFGRSYVDIEGSLVLFSMSLLDVLQSCVHLCHFASKGWEKGGSYTTICLRASRGLRMNLRVRRVTGVSAILVVSGDAGSQMSVDVDFQFSCASRLRLSASLDRGILI